MCTTLAVQGFEWTFVYDEDLGIYIMDDFNVSTTEVKKIDIVADIRNEPDWCAFSSPTPLPNSLPAAGWTGHLIGSIHCCISVTGYSHAQDRHRLTRVHQLIFRTAAAAVACMSEVARG